MRVYVTDKVQRIARIHQLRFKDCPNSRSQNVQYPERQLLGFSDCDEELIRNIILECINF